MFLVDCKPQGWDDVFKKPWAETVRDGSPHFPDGKLAVQLTMHVRVCGGIEMR